MAFPKKKRSNSPVKTALRRLPGQSVRDELERIVEDQIGAYVFYPLAIWGLVAWQVARQWLGAGLHLSMLVFFAALMSI